jgi:hypothetical protein
MSRPFSDQRVRRIAMADAPDILIDDRFFIQIAGDIMRSR